MINPSFDQIDKSDIDRLLADQVSEKKTLDYKRELPDNSDANKKEFLADVSSFANASGGDLIYGVKEKDGKGYPDEIPGIKVENPDEEKRRLENIIRDGIAPKISGVQIKVIEGFGDRQVLVIRIPKGWNSPHMVIYKGTSRFYSRNSTAKHQLDVTEIRNAFAESEEIPKKIERFIDDRLGKIVAEETPIPLDQGPKFALFILPYSSFGRSLQISVPEMKRVWQKLYIFHEPSTCLINVDGLFGYIPKGISYSQTFRNGQFENVGGLRNSADHIYFTKFAIKFAEDLTRTLKTLKDLNVPPPFVVKLLIIGAKGRRDPGDNNHPADPINIDRDLVSLPEGLGEDYETDVHDLIKPILDGLWNARGLDKCDLYGEDGKWKT